MGFFRREKWQNVVNDALRAFGRQHEEAGQSGDEKAIAELRVMDVLQRVVNNANSHSRKSKDYINLHERLTQFSQSDAGLFRIKRNGNEFCVEDRDANVAFVLAVYKLNVSFSAEMPMGNKRVIFVRRLENVPADEAIGLRDSRFWSVNDFAEFLVQDFIYAPDPTLTEASRQNNFSELYIHFSNYLLRS